MYHSPSSALFTNEDCPSSAISFPNISWVQWRTVRGLSPRCCSDLLDSGVLLDYRTWSEIGTGLRDGPFYTWAARNFYVQVRAVRSLYIHHRSLTASVPGSAHGIGTDASASQHIRLLLERGFACAISRWLHKASSSEPCFHPS